MIANGPGMGGRRGAARSGVTPYGAGAAQPRQQGSGLSAYSSQQTPSGPPADWEQSGKPGYDPNAIRLGVAGFARDGSAFGYKDEAKAYDRWRSGPRSQSGTASPQAQPPGNAAPIPQPNFGTPYRKQSSQQMPGATFGPQGFGGYSQAGNVANDPYNKPAPFASTMQDGYGNPTTVDQFYGQQQNMIGNLINRLGALNNGTYLGRGSPPPSWSAPPSFDPGAMWRQAGDMSPGGQYGRAMAGPFAFPWMQQAASQGYMF